MRDDLKSHSGMSGTAPYILPRASSTPLRSATRTSPTSFSESDPVSRASMESGTSGARVKQADRVILGRSNGMPDLPSTHTHPYRQVVQNDSRQAIRQNGQPGKQASHQVAASRTGTPNGRKQPRKSPPANQAAKLRQASFEVIARQPTPGHDKHREATKNRPVASTQVQHKRRHQMSPKGSPPAEKGHKMKLKVRPSRSSSFASVGPAKANTSSTTSSKKSERKRSSESQSSEHSPSLAGYRTFRSETHKISLPSTGCRKNSAATQKNFTTPPPKKKNTTRNEQERTDPELTLSIGQRRALSKDQGSIRCPSRLQSESLHASKAEYSLHRSTFIPGICTSPDQLPERITDLRLSSDFKAAGAGHPKPRYSQATFSSKTYTDRGSTSKAKISLSIRNFFHKRNSKNALRSTGNTELAESISNINSDRSPAARNGRSSANFQQKSASNSGRTPTPAAVKKDASSPRDQGSPDQAMSSSPIPKSPASDISSETPSLVKYVREIASNLPSGTVERFRLLNITEIIMSTVENAKRAEIYAQEARANAVEAEHQSELAQLAVTQIRQMLGKGTSYGEGVKSLLRLSEARKAGRSKH
ncbi:hypothetical protein AOQ84DRAFT_165121 [Glonium stellatum]|uniref:Uncharacterized protein n=1 Tax=Glonium stellatum TaxID=574774 RepID=A0A8E2JWU3_9PEZI|nr:hypothetical protein AOQ84DRAFT_165121 [Glonium stellatum]